MNRTFLLTPLVFYLPFVTAFAQIDTVRKKKAQFKKWKYFEREKPPTFKKYTRLGIDSWYSEGWKFSTVPGTNRIKSVTEITNAKSILMEQSR
ncbi:MAG: hypothetical protein ABJA71_06155 [Ginsengibacter sp.]